MATEHFCLRWNNHQSTLVSVFDNLLESGTLVDCTLAADGRYLKAHKVVLSACSPYLGMLLSQHHDKHPIIILKDVKFEELKAMLDYMYRGEVNISQEQLTTFLKAAESLQIKGLTDTGGEEALQPVRPASSNSTASANNEDPASPSETGSPSRKRRRNRTVEEMPDCETKLTISDTSVGSVGGSGNKSSVGVKREPVDVEEGGVNMSVDESGDSAMMARPGPSNGGSTNNKGSPWMLPGDNAEEMQLTPGQGSQQHSQQQQQYMQNMMQMYGNMWMDGMNPMDMDQEMLAAYNYGRPNWNQNRYICTTCGRTYSLQASLYNHKKFECGKMPNFICPYCPHRTKQKGNLKTHIKKRHPEFFSEPFMPSPSRLNSMMNSIMMQSTMAQNSLLQNSQNTHNRSLPMQNSLQSPSSPMMQSAKSPMQNMPQSSLMQTPTKNQNMNNLLQAMKQQMPQNSSNAMAANLVQALQSLPNSTSISALEIMHALTQGSPKSPMTPQRMSPMSASPANPNPPQSPMSANQSNNSSNFNPPSVPPPNVNGADKSEASKSPELPSEVPKSPAISSFTSLSLEVADSEDSSDTSILPSYPVSE